MKVASVPGHLQYRCRRCESYVEPAQVEDISAALSNLAGPLPLHGCDDGGYGVVDLLGARPLDVARLDEEGGR